jgi:dipeptidyl aminopeptidase/acylaminoacyl peptidase
LKVQHDAYNFSPLSASLLILTAAAGFAATSAFASGPAERVATDPKAVVSAVQAGGKPVSVADLLETNRFSGAAIAPDASAIAYISNASGRFNLWIMRADGTEAHQLLHSDDGQSSPTFTRDAKTLIYQQDKGGDESHDLYAIAVTGGEPRNLTNTPETNETSPLFSPSGTLLAFGSKDKSSPNTNLGLMEWPAATTRLLTHETDPQASWAPIAWSPDGKTLFAVRAVGTDDADVYSIDIASGAAEKLTAHTGKQLISLSAVSPDGKTLLMTSDEKGGFANVLLFDLATKQKRWVTDTQWDASAGDFAPDGKSFTYSLNADGRTTIQFVDVATLKSSDRGVPSGLNFGAADQNSFFPDGSYLVAHQDSTHPANMLVLHPNGKIDKITQSESPALAAAVAPQSQLVTYKSFDGRMISALVWVPFNLKRDHSAPAVVLPHGGPTGQTIDSFNGRALLLVSRGFLVIAPNVRGSTGYGMEFQKANFKDLGGADLKDEIAGVDFLKATGYVDGKKVGIWGGSYGGFMTLMAIGKSPEVWAAGVDEYGILNWYTMLQHEDPRLQEYEKSLLGDPEKDRAVYEASSPLKYIRNERAPLLVLQGVNDIRVPKEEAEQVVSILKAEGRTVDAVYYPEEGHGFMKKEHQIDELTRSVEWLERYLQGKAPAAAGQPN